MFCFCFCFFNWSACAEFLRKQFSSFVLIRVSISQSSILDLLTHATVSQDLCMGLLGWFLLWCVCVGVCGQLLHDGWSWPNLFCLFVCFSSVLSVLLQCGREWKTATCIHWYNTLPPKPPPSVNQQAEWILMEPIYPASVLPPCVQPTSCVTLTWFSVFPSTFCMTLVTLY